MILEVEPGSAVPPYEQIRAQVSALVASGQLAVGARLPPIRQLAGDLELAAGTVARAYRELESEGVVISRRRHGTTVAPQRRLSARENSLLLTHAAREFALAVNTAGAGRADAIAELDHALAEIAAERP